MEQSILLGKLTAVQLVQSLTAIYVNVMFITMFTKVGHSSLFWL
jgi:hypothetical protein